MNREVIVLGAGGHAKVVVSTLEAAGYQVVGLFDDNSARIGSQVLGVPVLGPLAAVTEATTRQAVIGIGDNRTRRKLAEQFDLEWLAVVHPQAYVHASVTLGSGSVVFAGAVVQPDTRIGSHVVLNTSCSVDHDCILEEFVHIGPGSRLAGTIFVGQGAFLGIGSVVLPNRRIGEWSVVGGGGVVVHNPPAHATVAGVPARLLQK